MNPVNAALWYVESHFASDLTLEELACRAGVSTFYRGVAADWALTRGRQSMLGRPGRFLHCPEKFDERVDPFTRLLVVWAAEHFAPDRHLPVAVCGCDLAAVDVRRHGVGREDIAVAPRKDAQVRYWGPHGGRRWSVALAVDAVTRSAVISIQVYALRQVRGPRGQRDGECSGG
jgi:hypothetical protein